MIAGLYGVIEALLPEGVILNVGGVCFQVYLPSPALQELGRTGERVHLYTHLHVREDVLALYGFTSAEELGVFQRLLGVGGIGPRTALALLSALGPDELRAAIVTEDASRLAAVPGIGKKTAQRLILELKSKLEKEWVGVPLGRATPVNAEVVAALTTLGYSTAEASAALAAIPPGGELTLEEKVRLTLQHLAKR